jgi:DNA (cytosine-5)-methyltransferase 1
VTSDVDHSTCPLRGIITTRLRVLDLFCGAGGFSEGFRRNGFEIVRAIDNWVPAVRTFSLNHAMTDVMEADIREIHPEGIGRFDVIIGGPPCNEFSYANKGGSGDCRKGMLLVAAFLNCVAIIRPKFWLMENVPRLLKFLPRQVDLGKFGMDGGILNVPVISLANAADFGVPQRRTRAVIGNYPLLRQTHSAKSSRQEWFVDGGPAPWNTMARIINGLPNPQGPVPFCPVVDPNFPEISIPARTMTDHFYDTTLTTREAHSSETKKTHHQWYGKMRFPDSLELPSRTITAVQVKGSREAIVIQGDSSSSFKYRSPTLREYASLQTFPVTYQFTGSLSTKMRLIGNAFPPMLAEVFAKAITKHEVDNG